MDEDGYPTEETLKRIEDWPHTDIPGVFAFMRSLWWYAEWGVSNQLRPGERGVCQVRDGEEVIRFATGGWSGNESLIHALCQNVVIWKSTWLLSARGGLHIFRIS